MAHQEQADGCVLPEELRRYYLETMGIQVWDELYPETAPVVAGQEITATPAIKNLVQENPVRENSVQEKLAQENSAQAARAEKIQPDVAGSNWLQLEATVRDCDQCGLQATRTQVVFGTGKQTASLLVIGDAPGQEEDAQGLPFVGEAGQLLSAMLQAIDLRRDEVYLTHVLKCHAPDNRDPLPAEIKNCTVYLRRQIELLQPKVIFSVGRIAAQTLLNSSESISELRERQHSFAGIPLITSFHPVYLLRKPSEKRKSWQDLLQVKRLLAE